MNRRPYQSRQDFDSFSPKHARFSAVSPDRHFFESRRRHNPFWAILFWAVLLLVFFFCVNTVSNLFVHVRTVTVPIRGLTEAFDGYTILQVSDLKGRVFGPDQLFFSTAVGKKPFDAVIMTGDMLSPAGSSEAMLGLIDRLAMINSEVPIYFIAGDSDPEIASMEHASTGSPFAGWVRSAVNHGATLLSSPQPVTRGEQTLWLTTFSQLSLDLDSMERQYYRHYLDANASGDSDAIELAAFNLQTVQQTREARNRFADSDILIAATHTPLSESHLRAVSGTSLIGRIRLILSGHYLGGLIRIPWLGPIFVPDKDAENYGILPGEEPYGSLSRVGSTYVYNSPGLGSGDDQYPIWFFRLFNPPTVTLIRLTPSSL